MIAVSDLHLTAKCAAHGKLLTYCDECGNTLIYAAWAREQTGPGLAERLERIATSPRYFHPNESGALLAEAARRLRADGQ